MSWLRAMGSLCLPPPARVFLRGTLVGVLLGCLLAVWSVRSHGASPVELLRGRPVLLVAAWVVLMLVILLTRGPRNAEPDWAAIARRSWVRRLSWVILLVGLVFSALACAIILASAIACIWVPSLNEGGRFWPFFGSVLLLCAGLVLASLGMSIRNAAQPARDAEGEG